MNKCKGDCLFIDESHEMEGIYYFCENELKYTKYDLYNDNYQYTYKNMNPNCSGCKFYCSIKWTRQYILDNYFNEVEEK